MAAARKSSKTNTPIRSSEDKPVKKMRKLKAPTDRPKNGQRSLATRDRPAKNMTTPKSAGAGKFAEIRAPSKIATIIALLKQGDGATIARLCEVTDWQAHSVRGVLSGIVKKKLGLEVASAKTNGFRTYRIVG